MKISAVPASSTHPNNNNESSKHETVAPHKNHKFHKKQSKRKHRHENDSSSSCCSECSDSGSDSSSTANNRGQQKRGGNKSTNFKPTTAAATTTTTTSSDSSDDDDSEDEFPKMNVSSGRGNPKPNNKLNATADGADGASSSDMELPALVSAAIQRVESFSDGENSKTDPIPQYTSTLLRDFMVKTQMMGSTFTAAAAAASNSAVDKKDGRQFDGSGGGAAAAAATTTTATSNHWQQCNKDIKTESPQLPESAPQKRKRGRPKKQIPLVVNDVSLPASECPLSPPRPTFRSKIIFFFFFNFSDQRVTRLGHNIDTAQSRDDRRRNQQIDPQTTKQIADEKIGNVGRKTQAKHHQLGEEHLRHRKGLVSAETKETRRERVVVGGDDDEGHAVRRSARPGMA